MSGRTCMKCRLHGKIVPLKGHKRNCPYTNCNCLRCASHDNYLEKGNSKRSENSDKGLQWRQNLNAEIEAKSGSPRGFINCSTSTSTQTSTQTSTSVSVVQFPKPRKEEDSHNSHNFNDKITSLRQMLPTVPEAKLAALLAGNGGDMDAVV